MTEGTMREKSDGDEVREDEEAMLTMEEGAEEGVEAEAEGASKREEGRACPALV